MRWGPKIMLEYDENSKNTKILAVHYAKKIGDNTLIAFMGGELEIKNNEEAQAVIEGFWKMTDLAISDNHNDVIIQDISDIEFWMLKLFHKVGGYLIKQGYKTQWEASFGER